MIVKRTYSFNERVRVLTLATPEGEVALDKLCAATRLQEVEYEVVGASLGLAAQAHLLEIELPLGVDLPDGLATPMEKPLRVELQRLDGANPEERQWCQGIFTSEGLLMAVLPPEATRPLAEKKAALGFRTRI